MSVETPNPFHMVPDIRGLLQDKEVNVTSGQGHQQ